MTEILFSTIFEKEFMANITWTGKGKKGVKKVALSKFPKCVELVVQLATAASKSYTKQLCEQCIKYKILKYAYRATQDPENAENNENTETVTGETVQVLYVETIPSISQTQSNLNQPNTSVPSIEQLRSNISYAPPSAINVPSPIMGKISQSHQLHHYQQYPLQYNSKMYCSPQAGQIMSIPIVHEPLPDYNKKK